MIYQACRLPSKQKKSVSARDHGFCCRPAVAIKMKVLRKFLILQLVALYVAAHVGYAQGLRPIHARKAIVVSVHQEASRVGAEIMRQGGNAVDAGVATGFAVAVVHPAAGNIGGGGFMLLRKANGEVHFLDFREKAPKAASRDMYLDAQGNVIPNASLIGYKAIGVPGSVAGWLRWPSPLGGESLEHRRQWAEPPCPAREAARGHEYPRRERLGYLAAG